MYIITTRRITSGDELKWRKGLGGLRVSASRRARDQRLTSDAFALRRPLNTVWTDVDVCELLYDAKIVNNSGIAFIRRRHTFWSQRTLSG